MLTRVFLSVIFRIETCPATRITLMLNTHVLILTSSETSATCSAVLNWKLESLEFLTKLLTLPFDFYWTNWFFCDTKKLIEGFICSTSFLI